MDMISCPVAIVGGGKLARARKLRISSARLLRVRYMRYKYRTTYHSLPCRLFLISHHLFVSLLVLCYDVPKHENVRRGMITISRNVTDLFLPALALEPYVGVVPRTLEPLIPNSRSRKLQHVYCVWYLYILIDFYVGIVKCASKYIDEEQFSQNLLLG